MLRRLQSLILFPIRTPEVAHFNQLFQFLIYNAVSAKWSITCLFSYLLLHENENIFLLCFRFFFFHVQQTLSFHSILIEDECYLQPSTQVQRCCNLDPYWGMLRCHYPMFTQHFKSLPVFSNILYNSSTCPGKTIVS